MIKRAGMTDEPHIHDLAQQIARLEGQLEAQEERMKTMTAENEGALDRLRADMAKRDADLAADRAKRDADMAKRDVEAAKRDADMAADRAKRDVEAARRDKDNQRWTITLVLGCTALVIGAVALFS